MRTMIYQDDRPALAFSPQGRAERISAYSPERLREAMLFLSGYAPATCEAVLDATEPFEAPDADGIADGDLHLAWTPATT